MIRKFIFIGSSHDDNFSKVQESYYQVKCLNIIPKFSLETSGSTSIKAFKPKYYYKKIKQIGGDLKKEFNVRFVQAPPSKVSL